MLYLRSRINSTGKTQHISLKDKQIFPSISSLLKHFSIGIYTHTHKLTKSAFRAKETISQLEVLQVNNYLFLA